MNLSTIALLLIAWQALKGSKPSSDAPKQNLTDFLSDDTKNIINCFGKITDKQASQEDRTGAIFQMMTNPAIMNIASQLFKGKEQQKDSPMQNEEGYKFEQTSKESQEFFRPIDNIADAEVKHKLYWFYDNWYIK